MARLRVLTAFAVILLIWGVNYSFVKLGLSYSPPIWFAFLRTSSGLIVAAGLLLALRTKGSLSARQKVYAFLVGVPGSGIFFGLWMLGQLSIPPGEASVFIYTFPLWTLFLSIPVLGDRPPMLKVGAAFLGFGGVALVAGVGNAGWTDNLFAMALLVAAGFSFALDAVVFKRLFEGEQMLRANVWQLGGGTLFLALLAPLVEPIRAVEPTWPLAEAIVGTGVLGTAVVFTLWFMLLSRYNAASFAAYVSLVVVVALGASHFIFGESVGALQLAGVAALVVSVYLISKTGSVHSGSEGDASFEARRQPSPGQRRRAVSSAPPTLSRGSERHVLAD